MTENMASQGFYPSKGDSKYHRDDDEVAIAPPVEEETLGLEARQTSWNDLPCLFMFAMTTALLTISAFGYGMPELSTKSDSEDRDKYEMSDHTKMMLKRIFGICLASIVVSILLTQGWIRLLIRYGTSIVNTAFYVNAGLYMVFGMILIGAANANAGYAFGAIMIAIGIIILFVKYYWKSRIYFAGENLSAASAVIKEYPMTLSVSLLMAVFSLVWLIIGFFGLVGVVKLFNDNEDRKGFGFVMFLGVFNVYWGVQVLKGILFACTSGIVGTWWTQVAEDRTNPTWNSLKRATTTSLGSICLGASIVAFVKIIRSYANRNYRSQGGMLAAIAVCLAYFLETLVQYFTEYTFIYVGLYGEKFIPSGKSVYQLFKSRGFTTIVNDFIVERVLRLIAMTTGIIGAAIGLLFGLAAAHDLSSHDRRTLIVSSGCFCFAIGVLVAMLVLVVLEAAVKSIFVCWAKAPDDLQRTHPDIFPRILRAWSMLFPTAMQESGYKDRYEASTTAPEDSNIPGDEAHQPLRAP